MSSNLSTLNGRNLSELAYLADKIESLEGVKGEKLTDVFFESDGVTIRNDIKQDARLNAFAEQVKDNPDYQNILNNYRLVEVNTDSNTGYKGIAVQDVSDNSLSMAHAGTDLDDVIKVVQGSGRQIITIGKDGLNDVQMALGETPAQLESAKTFIRELKENNVITESTVVNTTGHSLGGALAQLTAIYLAEQGLLGEVKTYESFGTKEIIENNPELNNSYINHRLEIDSKIKNNASSNDGISSWGKQIGTTIDPFNKDGVYSRSGIIDSIDTTLPSHGLSNFNYLKYNDEGDVILGEVNVKNLLAAIKSDPDNISYYLEVYDQIKGFEPYDPNGGVNGLVSEYEIEVPWNKDNTFYVPDGNGGYMINELHKDYLASLNSFTVRRRDPLSIDLDGDGVETVSTENVVYFDLNKNGFAEKMGWGGVSNKMIIPVS